MTPEIKSLREAIQQDKERLMYAEGQQYYRDLEDIKELEKKLAQMEAEAGVIKPKADDPSAWLKKKKDESKAKTNNDIKATLEAVGLSEEHALLVTKLLAAGKIPYTKVNYSVVRK